VFHGGSYPLPQHKKQNRPLRETKLLLSFAPTVFPLLAPPPTRSAYPSSPPPPSSSTSVILTAAMLFVTRCVPFFPGRGGAARKVFRAFPLMFPYPHKRLMIPPFLGGSDSLVCFVLEHSFLPSRTRPPSKPQPYL